MVSPYSVLLNLNHLYMPPLYIKIKVKAGKALARTSLKKGEETLIVTYKAISKFLVNCTALVWYPNLSDTNCNNFHLCYPLHYRLYRAA